MKSVCMYVYMCVCELVLGRMSSDSRSGSNLSSIALQNVKQYGQN